jgi:hypothetical protein
MDFTNALTMRSSNMASMRAAHLALSTLTGSTLTLTTHIAAPMAMYSTLIGSTIAVSTLTVTSSLLTTGDVGIGTTNPLSQLTLHGGNRSTSITVANGFNSSFFTQYGLAHSAGQYSAHSVAGDTVIDAVGGNLIMESPSKNIYLSVPNANTPNLLSIAGAGTQVTNNSAGWASLTNTQRYSNINLTWTAPETCYISSISMYLGQGNNGTNIAVYVNGNFINEWWPFQGYGLYVISATGSSVANGVATTPTPFSSMNQLIVQAGQTVSIWISALQTYNFFYYGRDSTTGGVGFSVVYSVPKVDLSLSNSTTKLLLGLAGVGIGTTAPVSALHVHNSSSSFTGAPTVHIGDGQTDAGGTYGMLHLVRANNAADNKAYLSFIKNGSSIFGMGYYPGSNVNVFGLVPSFSAMNVNSGLWINSAGSVGIGTTNPNAFLSVNAGATNTLALNLVSSGPGWGSGMQFTNSTASTGRIYGIYSGSDSALHVVDSTAGADRVIIDASGNITANAGRFTATGTIANINGGSNFAVLNNYMATGSLTIGDNTKNYGGGTSTWNTNTAGLMMECLDHTEIAVHDAATRVASMMYYSGNTITLGRDMGWGVANTTIPSGAVFTQKGGNSGANFFNIQGNDLGSSPYLGFYFNNTRRCYMGNTTATNVDIIAENGAQLSLGTGGVSRMTIDSAGDTSTTGKLTVQNVIRFGNYSGGNYDNIQFMRGTGSGQYPNIRCQENYIAMYVSDAGGWLAGSQVGDMVIRLNTGLNLRFGVGSNAGLVVDSSNNVLISQRELRVSQMNGHGQIRLKSGSTNISTIFHCNGTELYFLCTNNGDWEGGYNGLRPLKYNLTSGLVTMDNGLTVNNTITVASGDNSMTYYGPNSMWGAYLAVGSGTDKSNGNTAQVISTNGNLHLDGGNSLDMYYGYYTWARGTPNVHRFYGNIFINNWISIGTSTMSFPLYITIGRSYYWYLAAYLHSGGAHMHSAHGTWEVAIWAEKAIVTTYWFGTVSDQRIKKNIQPVGTMLETINKIEIMSFDFIDSANNKRDECGVIAQQLETVFPNAVDTSTGVIPCYLKFATSQYLVNGDVYILFDYDHNDVQQQFKVGDNIKIHAGQKTDTIDKDKGSHHVVVKSIIDGGFITAPWKDYDENDGVFLHGKEVDDFRNVDKEQLGILALKGVQELSSSVTSLQAANAAASSQMTALHGTCASLQQENTQLKSQVESLSSSHAALLESHAALLAWAQAQGFSG